MPYEIRQETNLFLLRHVGWEVVIRVIDMYKGAIDVWYTFWERLVNCCLKCVSEVRLGTYQEHIVDSHPNRGYPSN